MFGIELIEQAWKNESDNSRLGERVYFYRLVLLRFWMKNIQNYKLHI